MEGPGRAAPITVAPNRIRNLGLLGFVWVVVRPDWCLLPLPVGLLRPPSCRCRTRTCRVPRFRSCQANRSVYDRSQRQWRGLDVGATRLVLRAEIRRLQCRSCARVRTETVPWARPGARFIRDFEDVLTWLAQRMDKPAVSRLLRCSWEAVAGIVTRVVADHVDDARLDDVYRIGVDGVSYREGHRYLTVV